MRVPEPVDPPPPEEVPSSGAGTDAPGPTPPRAGARRPFLVRLSPELLDELKAWAAHDLRSLNAHIEYLLREAVRRRRGR